MVDLSKFKPNTVYVTYIAATSEQVWQGLTDPAFTKRYFGGLAVDVESKAGGFFRMLTPDGGVHISGKVVEWSPPRRFSCTWSVESMPGFDALPACLVTYDIEQTGEAVRLTMTEAHSWDIPDAILSGGRQGWPAILSSLKSLLENGNPLTIKMAPPQEMLDAIKGLKKWGKAGPNRPAGAGFR
jgi:uncharacterized protein YndB with AHSA1/START domain